MAMRSWIYTTIDSEHESSMLLALVPATSEYSEENCYLSYQSMKSKASITTYDPICNPLAACHCLFSYWRQGFEDKIELTLISEVEGLDNHLYVAKLTCINILEQNKIESGKEYVELSYHHLHRLGFQPKTL